jgi:hypothetical protein
MTHPLPLLESLTRRLAETPEEFLLPEPTISVVAIAHDTLRAFGVSNPPSLATNPITALTCWLLNDPWFLDHPDLAAQVQTLLATSLKPLAATVKAGDFVTAPDRREELARFCLAALGLRPQGETVAQAKDRLSALDSVERLKVIRDTQAAEARAQKIRIEMARKAAEEAAAKETRE